MLAAVLALAAAVATTIAYLALTAHLDYASVRRRQLDAWAAAAALVCFGVILIGNASVRRAHPAAQPTPPESSGAPVVPIPRLSPPRPERSEPQPAPARSEELVAIVEPADGMFVEGGLTAGQLSDIGGDGGAPGKNPPPLPDDPADPPVRVQPSPTIIRSTPTAAVGLPPTVPPRATSLRPAPTDVPPTQAPPPLPSATPHCGDPTLIDVEVGNMRTRRRNQGGDLVVEYSFDIRNHSSFPVTLRDMRATVSRLGGGGQEQFASQPLTDVTIEPGAVYPVASRVVLETRPPPVGQVQFCLTYATESCGRYNRSGNTRCQVVEGFWEELP